MKKLLLVVLAMFVVFVNNDARKFHKLSEVPWGKAPWEMDWDLSFEGVEFCEYNAFVDSMQAKGYVLKEKERRYSIFTGTYDGKYKDVSLIVYEKSGRAYLSEIYFKANRTWEEAKSLYDELKNDLIFDDGEEMPHTSDENLNIHHVRQGKNYFKKLYKQFRRENVAYETIVVAPEGLVTLNIIPQIVNPISKWFWKKGKYQVHLIYRDNILEDEI